MTTAPQPADEASETKSAVRVLPRLKKALLSGPSYGTLAALWALSEKQKEGR
ncbi:hypothetical protein [Enterovirga rhinocerotis]|uniref:Uncharacterized protein n=1 Tax=Enterovirga rhinocerotis TaxID=1339210 RepID=A0A4R7BZX4_9HYPH|nr:hypothetical protein [Enterovirga rhinocerotis]TDR90335.1 hypothetical protein EV668_3186 [Enterovirga rhinocerotis]